MSRVSFHLCVSICLGLGLAGFYAYGVLSMPGRDGSPVRPDQPPPPASVKPSGDLVTGSIEPNEAPVAPSINPRATVTPPIEPQAIGRQVAKIPGVQIASLDKQALPPPGAGRWAPAVGYGPVVAPARQAAPSAVKKPRKARGYRPYYYARPNFSFGIGIGPRW